MILNYLGEDVDLVLAVFILFLNAVVSTHTQRRRVVNCDAVKGMVVSPWN